MNEPESRSTSAVESQRIRYAERVSSAALIVSIVGSLSLVVVYWRGGQPQLEGLGLLAALGGLGVALVVWGRHLLDSGEVSELREPHVTSAEDRVGFDASLERDDMIGRRSALRRLLVASLAAFGAALLFPIRSLGPSPGQTLFGSPWRSGIRLVDDQNRPIRLADVPVNSLVTAFPDGAPGSAQGQVALVRVNARSIRPRPGREDWSPDGLLAYSKVCTHAGCPVSLYLADSHQLLCPCHQSSFDALRGAAPVQGPAARPLPQLPLTVDDEGVVRASGDLSDPIGPAWWNRP